MLIGGAATKPPSDMSSQVASAPSDLFGNELFLERRHRAQTSSSRASTRSSCPSSARKHDARHAWHAHKKGISVCGALDLAAPQARNRPEPQQLPARIQWRASIPSLTCWFLTQVDHSFIESAFRANILTTGHPLAGRTRRSSQESACHSSRRSSTRWGRSAPSSRIGDSAAAEVGREIPARIARSLSLLRRARTTPPTTRPPCASNSNATLSCGASSPTCSVSTSTTSSQST